MDSWKEAFLEREIADCEAIYPDRTGFMRSLFERGVFGYPLHWYIQYDAIPELSDFLGIHSAFGFSVGGSIVGSFRGVCGQGTSCRCGGA